MTYTKGYFQAYQHLPETLVAQYPQLNFDNHCYLRIALDNTFQAKWDTKIKRPAYKNLNEEALKQVIALLETYRTDKHLLLTHNQNSLNWRKKAS